MKIYLYIFRFSSFASNFPSSDIIYIYISHSIRVLQLHVTSIECLITCPRHFSLYFKRLTEHFLHHSYLLSPSKSVLHSLTVSVNIFEFQMPLSMFRMPICFVTCLFCVFLWCVCVEYICDISTCLTIEVFTFLLVYLSTNCYYSISVFVSSVKVRLQIKTNLNSLEWKVLR